MLSELMSLLVAQSGGGLSPWLILVIFLVIVFIVAWAMLRNTDDSGADIEAAEHVEDETPVEEAEVEEAVEVEPEPEPEPESEEPDDLKKIEGVGPKVAGLLNENGILTFAQLAEADVDKLNEMLEAASLQMMDPATWPEQAKLAAGGDWDALQKLQDELSGGR